MVEIAEVAPGNWSVWAESSSPFWVGSVDRCNLLRLRKNLHARLVAPCWDGRWARYRGIGAFVVVLLVACTGGGTGRVGQELKDKRL